MSIFISFCCGAYLTYRGVEQFTAMLIASGLTSNSKFLAHSIIWLNENSVEKSFRMQCGMLANNQAAVLDLQQQIDRGFFPRSTLEPIFARTYPDAPQASAQISEGMNICRSVNHSDASPNSSPESSAQGARR